MFRPLYIEISYLCGVASRLVHPFSRMWMFFYSELMNLYTPVEVVSGMPLLSQENNLLPSSVVTSILMVCFIILFPFLWHCVKSLRANATMKTTFSSFMDFGTVPCIMVASPQSLQRKHWQVLTDVWKAPMKDWIGWIVCYWLSALLGYMKIKRREL